MIAATHLDAASAAFVREVLETIDGVVPLVEAYVVGSAAVGPFDPATSDVDLVAVVERPLGGERPALLERLRTLEIPVRDLELVVYVQGAEPPAFELNFNARQEHPDESPHWFVIDAAVAQERAVPVWGDRPWSELFAPVPLERLGEAMEESLAWSERQSPDNEFARVNALRTRHWLDHGEWISKADVR